MDNRDILILCSPVHCYHDRELYYSNIDTLRKRAKRKGAALIIECTDFSIMGYELARALTTYNVRTIMVDYLDPLYQHLEIAIILTFYSVLKGAKITTLHEE